MKSSVDRIILLLSNAPSDIRKDMLCGYMKANNLSAYSDIGTRCMRVGQNLMCMCW